MRKYFLSVTILLAATVLISWGVKGHRAVAAIADNHLSSASKAAVHELLGDTSLADVSSWPDEVLHSQPAYRHTAPWHYLNLPLGLTYSEFEQKVKGMGDENVYGALRQQEQILGSTASTREEKIEALKFVVHFVGDLHQPMHISREEDKGGNTIQLNYDGKGTNLHALWDSKLIDHEGLTYEQMAAQYDHATPAQIRQWQGDPLMLWIWESYQASSKLYAEVDAMATRSIDDSYYDAHIGIIHDRIEKAGIRLAGVLNGIFKNGLAASSASAPVTGSGQSNPRETAGAQTPVTINAADAARHYNEYVRVCEKVYGVRAMESLTLVNLGAAYPNQLMTVVLRDKAKDAFPNIDGHAICVTGKLVNYRDRPEIVVTDPAEIVLSN